MLNTYLLPFVVWFGLLGGIFVCFEIGWRIGSKHLVSGKVSQTGVSVVDGAVFALLGLFIAFTFSAAVTHFEARRQGVVGEANAIGTAWLRLDVLPPEIQPLLKDLFRRYTDSRIAVYKKLPDLKAAEEELKVRDHLQAEIWGHAVTAARDSKAPMIGIAVLPALNQMFDIANTRTASARMHTPLVVFLLLFVLSFVSSVFSGYAMASEKKRNWLHILGFMFILSTSIYLIMDLEYPRVGMIQIDKSVDQTMLDLRASMK